MNFEHLLHIYWSKGFFFNKKIQPFNQNLMLFYKNINNFKLKNLKLIIKRFEISYFKFDYKLTFLELTLNKRKIINMYLSQIFNVNYFINDLIKYNMIRLYLIKTFKGISLFLSKPSNGQRTWSNAKNAKKLNNLVKNFVFQIKKKYNLFEKKIIKNKKFLLKKKKKKVIKIKLDIKKKINWF